MQTRNTKQKDLILDVIKNHPIHPTIYEIFELVQKQDATIGQATVYRNVKRFVEEGRIYLVKTKSGIDRYDYRHEHIHFECLKCGNIEDIYDDTLFKTLKNKFSTCSKEIVAYNISLDGYCHQCRENE